MEAAAAPWLPLSTSAENCRGEMLGARQALVDDELAAAPGVDGALSPGSLSVGLVGSMLAAELEASSESSSDELSGSASGLTGC